MNDEYPEYPEESDRRGPSAPPRRPSTTAVDDTVAHDGSHLADEVPATAPIAGGYHEPDVDGSLPPVKLPRWVLVVGAIGVVVALIAGSVMWWYNRQLDPPGGQGAEVAVQIPRGASTSGIGSILERRGVIANSMVFNFYVSRKGMGAFEAGGYVFRLNSSVDQAIAVLVAGPTGRTVDTDVAKLRIPEGLTVEKILQRTTAQIPRLTLKDLTAALAGGEVTSSLQPKGVKSFEGLLFPATYDVAAKSTAVDVMNLLADEMQSRVASRDPEAAITAIEARYGIRLDEYDLLKVASMVQAEAGSAEEAPKIATVIYNRLAKASAAYTLGIDAVDEYGARLAGVDVTTFRAKFPDDPYNTRKVAGLPPTPIGAPGDYALDAAFNPADGPWMYYVLTDPGVHTFVVTDAEFRAAKAVCARKGLGCGG